MPLGTAYAGFQSYMIAHGYLKNATKSLQGSAFSQVQAKLGQAIQQQLPTQLGQATQTLTGQTVGGKIVQQTSKGCLITEVFL